MTGRWERAADRIDRLLPWLVAGSLAAIAVSRVITARLALFDTAVTLNVYWRLAHGYDDVSALTGSHHLADHLSPVYLLLTPVFRLPGEVALSIAYIVQAVSVGLVGVAVRRLTSHLGLPPHIRIALMVATMLTPAAYLVTNFGVREYNIGVGFLAMATVGVIRGDAPQRTSVWALAAALTRVEYAVGVLLLGIVARRSGPAGRVALRVGAFSSMALVGWLLFGPLEGASVGYHLAHLGTTPSEAVSTALTSPHLLFEPVIDMAWLRALLGWLLPIGLVIPFFGGRWLLAALPSVAIPVLGVWPLADAYVEHYWYPLLALAPIAAAVGLAGRPVMWRPVAVMLPLAVLVTWVGFFPVDTPWLMPGRVLDPDARAAATALAEVDGSVSAPSPIVHLIADRPVVFAFPRPMSCEGLIAPFVPVGSARWIVTTDQAIEALIEEFSDRQGLLEAIAADAVPLAGRYHLVDATAAPASSLNSCSLD